MTRIQHTYKIKSYISASHAMRWEAGEGAEHNHTWQVICEIKTTDDHMIIFGELEQTLRSLFDHLAGQFLNEVAYFKDVNPTLENVTMYLFDVIAPAMTELQAELLALEVSESPTRSYKITA